MGAALVMAAGWTGLARQTTLFLLRRGKGCETNKWNERGLDLASLAYTYECTTRPTSLSLRSLQGGGRGGEGRRVISTQGGAQALRQCSPYSYFVSSTSTSTSSFSPLLLSLRSEWGRESLRGILGSGLFCSPCPW